MGATELRPEETVSLPGLLRRTQAPGLAACCSGLCVNQCGVGGPLSCLVWGEVGAGLCLKAPPGRAGAG